MAASANEERATATGSANEGVTGDDDSAVHLDGGPSASMAAAPPSISIRTDELAGAAHENASPDCKPGHGQ